MNDNNPRFGGNNLPAGSLSKLLPYAIAIAGVAGALIIVGYLAGFFGKEPAGTPAPGVSTQPGASASSDAGGSLAPATGSSATLEITTGPSEVKQSWSLDGVSGDVSPTATLIAGVWTKTIDNVAAGYGDLIVLSMGGPIVDGTQVTSKDLKMGFSISRTDASGTDLFSHTFSSEAGECSVTMQPSATGLTGTFTCSGIPSDTGLSVNANGTFSLEASS
jgi:hypothetical protein